MNIAQSGIDGLTMMKKLKTNAVFSGNRALADRIESALIQTNGYDKHLANLVKIHEPLRKQVNRSLVNSLENLEESLKNPQFNLVLTQIKLDA